jgi:hypothetical protein
MKQRIIRNCRNQDHSHNRVIFFDSFVHFVLFDQISKIRYGKFLKRCKVIPVVGRRGLYVCFL